MHKDRQNLQSTKKPPDKLNVTDEDDADAFPESPKPNIKINQVAHALVDRNNMNTAHQDLTGRFPVRSRKGNKCILVGYHCDANCILAHPVKNRLGPTLTAAWQHSQDEFAKAGTAPEVWVMDNEM